MATIRTNPAASEDATVIGESVQIKGNLSGDEDLHVLGRVEGRVELQRTLVVALTGIVKAEVTVKNAIVSGVVVGNIHASESVEITREGRMVGDIFAPRIIIVDGASFRGNVDMGDIANMPVRRPNSERPRPAPVAAPRPQTARPGAPAGRPVVTARGGDKSESKAPEAKPESRADAKGDPVRTVADAPRPAPTARPAPATSTVSTEPPQAKGLPQKAQKTRVIVKRR